MKVLLMGDASNYHACLAKGLAALGHQVTVASNGSQWMNTPRNIDLNRRPGKLGGLIFWLKLSALTFSQLRDYDVVHISNPNFLELKPRRIRSIFNMLKRQNGKIYLTMLGTDTYYVDMCLDQESPLAYTEWRIKGQPTNYAIQHAERLEAWEGKLLRDHCKYIYDNIDGAVSALYEYQLSCLRMLPAEMVAYGGIPIDMSQISPSHSNGNNEPLRIMLACHKGREAEKGADLMLPTIQEVVKKSNGAATLDFVQNVPFAQFSECLNRADIVVDQLYSYTPGTTALMAMAQGKATVSGGAQEYYDFIGEKELHPIIHIDPCNLSAFQSELQRIIEWPQLLEERKKQGAEFVKKHNDMVTVARRYENFWNQRS